jgi:hypothetical protein
MSKTKIGFLFFPMIFLMIGCVHTVVPSITSLQYVPEKMQLIGPVEGEASRTAILGIFGASPENDGYSTEAAMKDALSKVNGDAILNPTVDEDVRSYFFGVVSIYTLRVSGQGIRWTDTAGIPTPTPTPLPAGSPPPVE